MAIKISGTSVISNSRQLENIASIDNTTKATLQSAGLGSSVNVYGPVEVYNEEAATYAITNYDFDATYTASVTSGSVTVDGVNLLYTAPTVTTQTTTTLTVNYSKGGATVSSTFTITLKPIGIATPTLTMPAYTNISLSNRTYTSTTFDIQGTSGTHDGSDWQVATDSGFSNVVSSLSDSSSNLTSWNDTFQLSLNTQYYVRVRYRNDAESVVSDWSPTVSFRTTEAFTDAPTITYSSGVFTGSAYNITGTPPTGTVHTSSNWYLYSNAAGTTLITSITNDTTNLTSIGFADFAAAGATFTSGTTYYVRAIYNSNNIDPSELGGVTGGQFINTVSSASYPGGTLYNSDKGVVYYGSNYNGGTSASFTWRYFMGGARVTVMGGGGGGGNSPVIGGAGGGSGNIASYTMPTSVADSTSIPVTVGGGGSNWSGGYNNYANGASENLGGTGGTSSFGSYVSATGGRGGSIMWEGGRGGSGSAGGGGSTQVNNGSRVGYGGYDGQANGQDRSNSVQGPFQGTGYTNAYAGEGGTGDQGMINTVKNNVTGASMPQSNIGGFNPTGNVGTNAPGSPGGAGVQIAGITNYTSPSGGSAPDYGSYYIVYGNSGFGAGGRGAMGDAGGGARGYLAPGSAGHGGFVAIEWD